MRTAFLGLLLMSIGSAAASAQQGAVADDPYIWLEDVSGQRSMDWVNSHNATTQAVLEADPRYQRFYREALDIAQAKDRIPYGSFVGGQIYNFWQDARTSAASGVARRSPRTERKPAVEDRARPRFAAEAENANWVWKGSHCAWPAETRVSCSCRTAARMPSRRASSTLPSHAFVKDGFTLPKAKVRTRGRARTRCSSPRSGSRASSPHRAIRSS